MPVHIYRWKLLVERVHHAVRLVGGGVQRENHFVYGHLKRTKLLLRFSQEFLSLNSNISNCLFFHSIYLLIDRKVGIIQFAIKIIYDPLLIACSSICFLYKENLLNINMFLLLSNHDNVLTV